MKTRWEKVHDNGRICGVQVLDNEVSIWENFRGNPHTEVGCGIPFDKFLEGEQQGLVRNNLGEAVLEEVIAAIKNKLKDK